MTLPKDSKERKTYPLYSGLFRYFPAALAEVAHVSHVGNEQHNPGQSHFDNREKSNDDYDCLLRHLEEADTVDEDGLLHAAKVAWRALRGLQKILEKRGAAVAPAARWPSQEEEFARIVPVVNSIETQEEADARWAQCENDVRERIAGKTPAAREIADVYYYQTVGGKVPGTYVQHEPSGYMGIIVTREAQEEWYGRAACPAEESHLCPVLYTHDPDGNPVDKRFLDEDRYENLRVLPSEPK